MAQMKTDSVILIVEDEPAHRDLIEHNLRRAGLENEIRFFEEGEEALAFLLRNTEGINHEPGASYQMLLDIGLPGMSGIETLRKIKNEEALKKLPVTMLTTTDDPKEIDLCYTLGCSNYFIKPVEYGKLVEMVQALARFFPSWKRPSSTARLDDGAGHPPVRDFPHRSPVLTSAASPSHG